MTKDQGERVVRGGSWFNGPVVSCVLRTGSGTLPAAGATPRLPPCPGHSLTLCPLLFYPLPPIKVLLVLPLASLTPGGSD